MTLSSKHQRYMDFAARIADRAPPYQRFRMGCVIVRGGIPVSFGTNDMRKTHPRARRYTYPYLHAELAALIAANRDDTYGATAYIARVSKCKKCLGIARPCDVCQDELRRAGIREVYYTTRSGGVERMDL